ncbi:hypothetical protein D9M68_828510 [compost metagenome]
MLRKEVEPWRVIRTGEHHQTARAGDAGEGLADSDAVMGLGAAGLHRQVAPIQFGQGGGNGQRSSEPVACQVACDRVRQASPLGQGFQGHPGGGEALAQALLQVVGGVQQDVAGERPGARRLVRLASKGLTDLAEYRGA